MYKTIHFLQSPDKSASRYLRRAVAENSARIGYALDNSPLVRLFMKNES